MSKNIIHMKIPMDGYDSFLLSEKMIHDYVMGIKGILPEDYNLIVSPFDTTVVDGDAKIITIDFKQYSHNELIEIIDKAWRYDELNK